MAQCIVSRLPDRGPRVSDLFSGKDRRNLQTGFGTRPAFYTAGKVSCFQAGKAAVELNKPLTSIYRQG